jgi:sugar lactone lactonase YvrE
MRRRLATLIGALGALLTLPAQAANDVIDANASYPEGPLFVGAKLYVAEMGADRVSLYESGAKRTFFQERGCGPTALTPYRNGFAILCHIGGEILAVDNAGKVTARFGKGVLRDPNDGFADGRGGLYFSDPGAFSKTRKPEGHVYHLSAGGQLKRVASGLWYPNGVFVEGRAVYVSETFRRKVWRFTAAPSGALTAKALAVDVDAIAPKPKRAYAEAGPDGLERAPNGELVIAMYGEGRLLRVDRKGKLAGVIETPFPYVDNVAFGDAGAVLVGAYDNVNPPLRGEVRWWRGP